MMVQQGIVVQIRLHLRYSYTDPVSTVYLVGYLASWHRVLIDLDDCLHSSDILPCAVESTQANVFVHEVGPVLLFNSDCSYWSKIKPWHCILGILSVVYLSVLKKRRKNDPTFNEDVFVR